MTSPDDERVDEGADVVRAEVDKRLGGYLQSGQAKLSEEHADGTVRYAITPANPRAASIDITLDESVCSITVGNGEVELYDRRAEWPELGAILDDAVEGRYSEEIREGWLFERKIRMRFETAGLNPRYARLSYDQDEEAPPLGEVTYEAW